MTTEVLAAAAKYRKIQNVPEVRAAMLSICEANGYAGWSVFAAQNHEGFCAVVDSLFDMVEELGP